LDDKQLSFPFRFLNFITYLIHKGYIIPSTQYNLGNVIPDPFYETATVTRWANMTIVSGIEGINPPVAVQPSLKYIYPRHKPKYSEKNQQIPADIQAFIDSNKRTALMTFGNERIPSESTLREIVNYIQGEDRLAFLVALQNQEAYPKELISRLKGTKHVKLVEWVPQLEILNNTNVKVFFTHGGLHSYYESVDARKPMIIIPFNDE